MGDDLKGIGLEGCPTPKQLVLLLLGQESLALIRGYHRDIYCGTHGMVTAASRPLYQCLMDTPTHRPEPRQLRLIIAYFLLLLTTASLEFLPALAERILVRAEA